jgi:hypothetical protein
MSETTINVVVSVAITSAIVLLFFVLNRIVAPWNARRRIARVQSDVKAGKPLKRPAPTHFVEFDSEGFTVRAVQPETNPNSMKWSEVVKVTAFKRDLFAVDLICVFLSKADSSGIETDEDMGGWDEFVKGLPNNLAGCKAWEQWFTEVAFPAFDPKMTEIFNRCSASNHADSTSPNLVS